MSGLAMGADGAIGSTYNFMADKFVKIDALMKEGKIEEAREVQNVANKIIVALIKVGVMQAEKEVLNQLGFDFGICRRPFSAPTDEEKEFIKREIMPSLTAFK
jgi:N-acetylneuraminate lyase